MTDTTENTPIETQAAEAPIDPIKAAAKKLTIKELMASLGGVAGTKILKEREITLHMPAGEEVGLTVKELTKSQYDLLISMTSMDLPQVPMLDQNYTTARRDPLTGAIKPAGIYKEPNPNDPGYQSATQSWFNDSCILLGLLCAAEDFGVDLSLPEPERGEAISAKLEELGKSFPTPTLLDIAVEAALINRGIPLAEQLLSAVQTQQALNALGNLQDAQERLDEEFKVDSTV